MRCRSALTSWPRQTLLLNRLRRLYRPARVAGDRRGGRRFRRERRPRHVLRLARGRLNVYSVTPPGWTSRGRAQTCARAGRSRPKAYPKPGRQCPPRPARARRNARHVLNNPIRYTDPSGHWYCAGMNDCEQWVQSVLDQLKGAGDVGFGLWLFFMSYDGAVQQLIDRRGIRIQFAGIPADGITTGLASTALGVLTLNGEAGSPTILLSQRLGTSEPGAYAVGLFGHEATHLFQGFVPSLSTQGEATAYEVEYRIWQALGYSDMPGWIEELHEVYSGNGGHYTDKDLQEVKNVLAPMSWLYGHEPERPALKGLYDAIYGPGALTVAMDPVSVFAQLGATSRAVPTPTAPHRKRGR